MEVSFTRTAIVAPLSVTNIVLLSLLYSTVDSCALPRYSTVVSLAPNGARQCTTLPVCTYSRPVPIGFHWMLRLALSAPSPRRAAPGAAGAAASPLSADAPSRSAVVASVVITRPLASQSSSTEPKLDAGTRYEYGSVIRVTRTKAPSGAASISRMVAGAPMARTALDFTSMSASCPLV